MCSNHTVEELLHLKYAPLTSIDVERTFSFYKYLLSNRRRRFLISSLQHHLTIEFNRAIRMLDSKFSLINDKFIINSAYYIIGQSARTEESASARRASTASASRPNDSPEPTEDETEALPEPEFD